MHHGGAEHMLVDLAVAHAKQGFEVAIIAPRGPLDRDWTSLGIHRFVVPSADRNPRRLTSMAWAVRRALSRWAPDLVHAHNVKATGLSLAGSWMRPSRVPLLTTFHGVPADQLEKATRILACSDIVAAVSEGLRDELVENGLDGGRVEVVNNGIRQMASLDAGRRAAYDREFGLHNGVVAAVGRLEPQKAHDRFLAAAAVVLEACPGTTFLIIGDGSLRADLERHAADLGIHHAVRFTGTRDDARSLTARADVLVFASRWEGLSMAALEALAVGTPVVSTDVSGMRELLATGAGRIVGDGDPRDLADAITALLLDGDRRRVMGAAGRRLISERFTFEAMQTAYADLYGRLLHA
jgi:glycosyltransferase involved in cell wall biosynthesis